MRSGKYLEYASNLLGSHTPLLDKQQLKLFVNKFVNSRDRYLEICAKKGSPLFLIDQQALIKKASQFKTAFHAHIPDAYFYYAMKSNNHPLVSRNLVEQGFGLDVSSGKELGEALANNPSSIIFSGPGKTIQELTLACEHSGKVTVLMDSFAELKQLEQAAAKSNVRVRAGVRLMIEENGLWRKFGIPLRTLSQFFKEAKACTHVDLCGLQFHASWNLDTSKQTDFLARLGKELAKMDAPTLQSIKFVDIGGGYWPAEGEWMQPSATPEGKLKQCLDPQISEGMDHRCFEALAIDEFARQIAEALNENLFKYVKCNIFLEPGRWISNESMHILLKVMDKKAEDVVITDGGTNMIGWDRYETDYCPVINLSRPSSVEHSCMIFGSLCTPHDLWGYHYFGDGIEAGDVLLVANQGAYTYSLRQEFIKPLPSCEVV